MITSWCSGVPPGVQDGPGGEVQLQPGPAVPEGAEAAVQHGAGAVLPERAQADLQPGAAAAVQAGGGGAVRGLAPHLRRPLAPAAPVCHHKQCRPRSGETPAGPVIYLYLCQPELSINMPLIIQSFPF